MGLSTKSMLSILVLDSLTMGSTILDVSLGTSPACERSTCVDGACNTVGDMRVGGGDVWAVVESCETVKAALEEEEDCFISSTSLLSSTSLHVVGASIGVLVVLAELGTCVRTSLDGSVFFWNRHCDGLVATVSFGVEGSV